ncbi:unnamed protein product, partial [Nesidiocoris tenuis]
NCKIKLVSQNQRSLSVTSQNSYLDQISRPRPGDTTDSMEQISSRPIPSPREDISRHAIAQTAQNNNLSHATSSIRCQHMFNNSYIMNSYSLPRPPGPASLTVNAQQKPALVGEDQEGSIYEAYDPFDFLYSAPSSESCCSEPIYSTISKDISSPQHGPPLPPRNSAPVYAIPSKLFLQTQLNSWTKPEILDEDNIYSEVILGNYSSANNISYYCDQIRAAVQLLIQMYCHMYRVDFHLSVPPVAAIGNERELSEIHNTTLIHTGCIQRACPAWNYDSFRIDAQIFHGTRPLGIKTSSPNLTEFNSFQPRIIFDAWHNFDTTPVSLLPRESRIVITIYGISYNDGQDQTSPQQVELGWASIQLFNYSGPKMAEREILWEKRHYLLNHPQALPKVLLAAQSWDFSSLRDLHSMVHYWAPMDPISALQLLLPCFPDNTVRSKAVEWIEGLTQDQFVDYLPQIVQALKYENYEASALVRLLLDRCLTSPRAAHRLYWLLVHELPGDTPQNTCEQQSSEEKSRVCEARYFQRLQLVLRALLAISGGALRKAFMGQQLLVQGLAGVADNVKSSKEATRMTTLSQGLHNVHAALVSSPTCLPLSPSLFVSGIHVRSSSYFPSNTLPLKINFTNQEDNIVPAIFKVGDDLQQDMLTLQMIHLMDKLWLKEGLDLKMVTFACVPTGHKKRDRSPFVLTSDMAYVINGGDKPSARFHHFVDLCCQAFNIVRNEGNIILNLFMLMASSGAGGLTVDSIRYVQSALMPTLSNAEAAATFARKIQSSLKSWFTQFNFFLHNLAQLRFSGEHSDGELLSFVPKAYSMQQEGRLKSVEVFNYQKRYDPEKYYMYILKVERANQPDPSYLFRSYKEFCELQHKIGILFPLAKCYSLHGTSLHVGRSNIKQVAAKRMVEIKKFLTSLFKMADEICHSDLVYTFFHPLLRDQQESSIHQLKVKERKKNRLLHNDPHVIKGKIKLSIHYEKDTLWVMVQHVQELNYLANGQEPSTYVKVYLLPDPTKDTKRKTKVIKKNCHPSFMEMLEYRVPGGLDRIRQRYLQATVWNYDTLQENEFFGGTVIKLSDIDLSQETTQWYPLGNVHR